MQINILVPLTRQGKWMQGDNSKDDVCWAKSENMMATPTYLRITPQYNYE